MKRPPTTEHVKKKKKQCPFEAEEMKERAIAFKLIGGMVALFAFCIFLSSQVQL